MPTETAIVAADGGAKIGASRGTFRVRGQASYAPAIPTGTIGALTRFINSEIPGLNGSTSPVCVRSPSAKMQTTFP